MKRYKSIYAECDGQCECRECSKKKECLGENASFCETCPEGSKPRSGKCAKADNSGYLKGVCDKGYIPNKNDHTRCELLPK